MVPTDLTSSPARPAPSDYLGWLQADAGLLLDAARSAPQAAVPTCPGWTGRDVADHVGEVYAHKVASIRLGRRPEEGEWPWAPDDESVFGWFSERLGELVHEFSTRAPGDPAWTWFDDDQTVGFWLRRMAHETAIHRVDAELAGGRPLTPHDEALALDGVDEVLGTFLAADDVLQSTACDEGSSGSALVEAGERSWLLELPDGGSRLRAVIGPVDADVRIVGSAGEVYRALWNRPTDAEVSRDGTPDVLARLDGRLRVATQ